MNWVYESELRVHCHSPGCVTLGLDGCCSKGLGFPLYAGGMQNGRQGQAHRMLAGFTEEKLQHRELSLSPKPGSASWCLAYPEMPSHHLCPTQRPPPVGLPDVQGVRVRDASLLSLLL